MGIFSRKRNTPTATSHVASRPVAVAPAGTTFDPPTTVIEDITGDYTIDPATPGSASPPATRWSATVRGEFTDFEGTAHIDTATRRAPG